MAPPWALSAKSVLQIAFERSRTPPFKELGSPPAIDLYLLSGELLLPSQWRGGPRKRRWLLEIERESLDAVLHQLYQDIDAHGHHHGGGTRGDRLGGTLELLGVALRITNPRARISRSENRGKPF